MITSDVLDELKQNIHDLDQYFQSYLFMNDLLQSSNYGCGSKWIQMEAIQLHGYPTHDFQLISHRLQEIEEKFGCSRVTLEAYLKCRDYLNDIKDSKEMMSSISYQLIEWYIKVRSDQVILLLEEEEVVEEGEEVVEVEEIILVFLLV